MPELSPDDLSVPCQSVPSVEIRVLGPVELVVDGQRQPVRSARARRLLAMLALHRGRLVSHDRLADAVWGEHLPADPAAALQNQVSRLRAVLGAGIETGSGGYRIDPAVVTVDLDRLEDLLARLADAPVREDLDDALVMLRGPAFEDLDLDDASIEARRIDEAVALARRAAAHLAATRAWTIPAPRGELVGRAPDVAAVGRLLDGHRIVTLTGPGGVGKTALALVVADARRRVGTRGAFVDLGAVSAPGEVPIAIARALRLEWSEGVPSIGHLADAVGRNEVLVLLDNAEHVVDEVAVTVAELTARAPVTVLTTSRIALAVPGEQLWPVEPLGRGAAVELFERQARAAAPRWEPDASLDDVCDRLDGLPLAVELAASQVRWRTVGEIVTALERPLDTLERPRPRAAQRHTSLRAAIAASVHLLDHRRREDFDALGVFAAGCTAETAAAVWGEPDPHRARRALGDLVEQSLLRSETRPAGTRFRLLDTVRHFALEGLRHRAAEDQVRARHAAAMAALVADAAAAMWGPGETGWVERLDDERADVIAAHRYLVERDDRAAAVRLATDAYLTAWPRGWSDLRALLTEHDLDDASVPADVRFRARAMAADLVHFQGDADRAEDLARAAPGDPFAVLVLGDVALVRGDLDDAVGRYRSAAAAWTATGHGLAPIADASQALALAFAGRTDEAIAVARAAVAAADGRGCATAQAFGRYALGEALVGRDPDAAGSTLAEAIELATSVRGAFVANLARLTLATMTARRGDPRSALALYPTILAEWRRTGQWTQQWITLRTLVPVLRDAGDHDGAASVLAGLRAHGQTETWGADGAAIDELAAELADRGTAPGSAQELLALAERLVAR